MDLVKCRMCGEWEHWDDAYRITPCKGVPGRSVWLCATCEPELEKMIDNVRETVEEDLEKE